MSISGRHKGEAGGEGGGGKEYIGNIVCGILSKQVSSL
jgi:hypothetical protein